GPEEDAQEDRGQDVHDEQRPDPPARVGPVVDVHLERDQREPVAEARPERRQEEQAEAAVAEQRQPRGQVPGHVRGRVVAPRVDMGSREEYPGPQWHRGEPTRLTAGFWKSSIPKVDGWPSAKACRPRAK